MAIAMEFFNVVVAKKVVAAKYPGGIAQYIIDCGPTMLEDEYLIRRGAMGWFDVQLIISSLENVGFRFLDEIGKAVDIVVVDMIKGPMTPCDWLEFDSGKDGPRCWLRGAAPGDLSKSNRRGAEDQTIIAFGKNKIHILGEHIYSSTAASKISAAPPNAR